MNTLVYLAGIELKWSYLCLGMSESLIFWSDMEHQKPNLITLGERNETKENCHFLHAFLPIKA